MTQNAVRLGYAQPGFTKNVLQRETLSDTAFSGVAVPHSLQDDAIQSFISFAISDRPILWGAQPVNVVVLIGVNNDTRKIFTEVFDLLINILSDAQNVRKLAAAADYKDFHLTLTTQMELQA